MSIVSKVLKNVGFLFVGRLSVKLFGLLATILIARYLGDVGFGKYSFAFAFVSFFTIISEMGVIQIVVREISRYPEKAEEYLSNSLLIKLILSVISYILLVLFIRLMNYPLETSIAVYIAAFVLIIDAFNVYRAIYEVNLEMKYSVFFYAISRFIQLLLILFVIANDMGLYWIIIVTIAASGIHNCLMYFHSRKINSFKPKYNNKLSLFLLKESLPLALSSIFIIIYYRIDIVMLSFMDGDSAVGIYSAAYRFSESFTLIPNVLMISVFPLMSNYFTKDHSSCFLLYQKSLKYLIFLVLPIALITTIYSDFIVLQIFGTDFFDSYKPLQILIWATVFIFINYANGQFFVSINKQKLTLIYTGVGVIVNIVLNSILIPLYSYNGAAFATLLTELCITIISFGFVSSYVNIAAIVKNNIFSLISAIIMIALLISIKNYSDIFSLVIASFAYIISFYLMGGLDSYDKTLISKIRSKSYKKT